MKSNGIYYVTDCTTLCDGVKRCLYKCGRNVDSSLSLRTSSESLRESLLEAPSDIFPSFTSTEVITTDTLESSCESAVHKSSEKMSMEVSTSSVSCEDSTIVPETEQHHLTMESVDNDKKSICSFYLEGKCRFGSSCLSLHPSDFVVEKKDSTKKKENKKCDKRRKVPFSEEEEKGKKPPMKTAGDVRKRIQWDPDLKKEHFTVGYLDRFVGVVEKPFTAFSWEHLALVDLDQLAIPQHRIQYFCYRGTKVWDKNERFDNVYGSTGSNITIQQVIQEVDEEMDRKKLVFDGDDYEGDSDTDDDDIVVMGDVSDVKKNIDSKKEEFDKLRASHFLCIKVNNEALKSAVAEVQEAVVREEPVLRTCAMPTELFHVTLAMVRIDSPEAMTELINLLQELQPKLQALLADPQQRQIVAKGLSTFGARVLYTKLQVPSAFATIVEWLQDSLEKIEGVVITNHFDFVPHMTLIKVNRVIARERRSKYLNSILYNDYINNDFGVIDINNINLCIIEDRRGYDGFYLTCKKIEL